MNKKRVDELIPNAYDVLKDTHICEKDEKDSSVLVIDSTYRAYISSFGAAVTMGSLISATAFFAANSEENKKRTGADRGKIGKAVFEVLKKYNNNIKEADLFQYIKSHGQTNKTKELVLDAGVALKLAMNLYPPKPKNK